MLVLLSSVQEEQSEVAGASVERGLEDREIVHLDLSGREVWEGVGGGKGS